MDGDEGRGQDWDSERDCDMLLDMDGHKIDILSVYKEPWPDRENSPKEWVDYSVRLLAAEAVCVLWHTLMDSDADDHWEAVLIHIRNMTAGLEQVDRAVFTELLTENQRLGIIKMLAEQQYGVPVEVEDMFDGNGNKVGVGLRMKQIDVPDDLSGLEG